jgi:hypothetical protein
LTAKRSATSPDSALTVMKTFQCWSGFRKSYWSVGDQRMCPQTPRCIRKNMLLKKKKVRKSGCSHEHVVVIRPNILRNQ